MRKMKHIIPILVIIGLVACDDRPKDHQDTNRELIVTPFKKKSDNKPERNETDKYPGTYMSQDETCNIKISIEKSELMYKYRITTNTLKSSGNLKIDTVHNGVYFRFTNLSSESESYTIEAQVNDDEFLIQNYGNAMNQFHHIKECDLKYITFSKEK